jgi:hypothetical protein
VRAARAFPRRLEAMAPCREIRWLNARIGNRAAPAAKHRLAMCFEFRMQSTEGDHSEPIVMSSESLPGFSGSSTAVNLALTFPGFGW